MLPKDLHLSKLATYDPALYPGTACESFCSTDVSLDVAAATAAGRSTFPTDGLADWNEKCSWDKYCAGCAQCEDVNVVAGGYVNEDGPLGQCAAMCEVISDSAEAPVWKKVTRNWSELCNWGPCYGCPSCLPSNPPPPPCDASMYEDEYVMVKESAVEGFKIETVYYDTLYPAGQVLTDPNGTTTTDYSLCPCKRACGEDSECLAFVDVSYQDPPYCITKSNVSTIHDATTTDSTGAEIHKDTYIKKDAAADAGIEGEPVGKGRFGNNFMGED